MRRSEWQQAIVAVERRGKQITQEYEQDIQTLEETYAQQRGYWATEINEARDEQIQGIDGATDRLEGAERMFDALKEGRDQKRADLDHGYAMDMDGVKLELKELHEQTPLIDQVIDNAQLVTTLVKAGIEQVLDIKLDPIQMDPILLESGKAAAKAGVDQLERAWVNFKDACNRPLGDEEGPETPTPEQRLEELFDQVQQRFDDKYQDAPQTERESMQLQLDDNFDLLREAVERGQEKEPEPQAPGKAPQQNVSLVDRVIDNPEVVIEVTKVLVEQTLDVTLDAFKMDPMVLEAGKMSATILKNGVEIAWENYKEAVNRPPGDRQGPETPEIEPDDPPL